MVEGRLSGMGGEIVEGRLSGMGGRWLRRVVRDGRGDG